jgi:hypothetical protein
MATPPHHLPGWLLPAPLHQASCPAVAPPACPCPSRDSWSDESNHQNRIHGVEKTLAAVGIWGKSVVCWVRPLIPSLRQPALTSRSSAMFVFFSLISLVLFDWLALPCFYQLLYTDLDPITCHRYILT